MPLDPSTLTVAQLWDGYASIEAQIRSLRAQQSLLSMQITVRERLTGDRDRLSPGTDQTVSV